MPKLVPIATPADVDDYIPPQGFAVVFIQNTGGNIQLCCKLPDGTIQTIASTQQKAVIDEIRETAELSQITVVATAPETAVIAGTVEEGSEVFQLI